MATSKSHTRILIGAGCFADAEAAIRLVDRILMNIPAELGGVLVDEGFMTNIMAWPGQRIVTSTGSLMDPPSVEQIRALVESDARAFQNKLAALARARSVKWSFERRSGDLIHGLFEAARDWDILMLGHREMHRRPGLVVVIGGGPSASDRAEKLAQELAGALKTERLALTRLTAKSEVELDDPFHIFVESESELLAQLSKINAAAVIIDLEASPMHTENELGRLLDAARCPAVILGAGQGQGSSEESMIASAVTDNQMTPEDGR